MTFQLNFLGTEPIDFSFVKSFSFTSSFFNLLPEANLVLNGISAQFTSRVKKGTLIEVVFTDDSGKQYPINMKVVNLKRDPVNKGTIMDSITIHLVHELFFKDTLKSTSWGTDTSYISDIVLDVINKDFGRDYFNEINSCITDEKPSIRYQLNENSLDFINNLSNKALKDNGPVYFYIDAFNRFNIMSVQEKTGVTPKFELVPMLDSAQGQYMGISSDPDMIERIPLLSYNLSNDANPCSILNAIFTTDNFVSAENFSKSKCFGGYELINGKTDSLTPSQTKYYSWCYTPSDAAALAAKEFFEAGVDSSYIAAYLGNLTSKIDVGTKVQFTFPMDEYLKRVSNDNTAVLSESGQYLVFKVSYIYTGSDFKTKLHLLDITDSI